VDGVLADFRTAFRALARPDESATDSDVLSPKGDSPLEPSQVRQLWAAIAHAPNWWLQLKAYEPDEIPRFYAITRQLGWEVFFMTKRPPSAGETVLVQTQWWLERHGFYMPAVVTVPGSRGELANALRLDLIVDDQMVNCVEVISASSSKAVLMLRDARQSALKTQATSRGIGVVATFHDALGVMQRLHEILPQRKGRLARLTDWFRSGEDQATSVPLDPRPFRPPETIR
jgi:hypothetical protein